MINPEHQVDFNFSSSLMRAEAIELLEQHGTRQKAPRRLLQALFRLKESLKRGLTPFQVVDSVMLSIPIQSRTGEVQMILSCDTAVPYKARWIRMKAERHIPELVLPREGEPLIFENWGMGERIDRPEQVTEDLSETEYVTYINPRPAEPREVAPYRQALDIFLNRYPVNQ